MHACIISPHFDVWFPTCFIYALKCIRASWCTELCSVVFLGSALHLLANTTFLSIKRRRLTCVNTERPITILTVLFLNSSKKSALKWATTMASHMLSNPPSMNTKSRHTESETWFVLKEYLVWIWAEKAVWIFGFFPYASDRPLPLPDFINYLRI